MEFGRVNIPTGFEPAAVSTNRVKDFLQAAESGDVKSDAECVDPRLSAIIDAWDNLPESLKEAVHALLIGGQS